MYYNLLALSVVFLTKAICKLWYMGAFDDNRKKRGIKSKRGGGINNIRYIIGLIFLLLIFAWLLMVDMEPWLEVLLTEEKPVPQCQMESGDAGQMGSLIYAPVKNGESYLWIAHRADEISNCGFRKMDEDDDIQKIPVGLTNGLDESDLLAFDSVSVAKFRVLEEVYCQAIDWSREYGDLRMVAGWFNCPGLPEAASGDKKMFAAIYFSELEDGKSLGFLWDENQTETPLTELVFSIREINHLTGFGIFEDIALRQQKDHIPELNSILALGYQADYFSKRQDALRQSNESD